MKEVDVTDLSDEYREFINPESKERSGLMLSREAYKFLKDYLGLPDYTISFHVHCDLNDVVRVDVEYYPRAKPAPPAVPIAAPPDTDGITKKGL